MSTMAANCPGCGKMLRLPEAAGSQMVRCPECHQVFATVEYDSSPDPAKPAAESPIPVKPPAVQRGAPAPRSAARRPAPAATPPSSEQVAESRKPQRPALRSRDEDVAEAERRPKPTAK